MFSVDLCSSCFYILNAFLFLFKFHVAAYTLCISSAIHVHVYNCQKSYFNSFDPAIAIKKRKLGVDYLNCGSWPDICINTSKLQLNNYWT